MRAIVLEKFGGLDSLVYKDIPEPEPKAGQVVIEIKAFGINHAEMHMRRGEWAEAAPVSGIECVGLVKSCPGGEFPVGAKAGPARYPAWDCAWMLDPAEAGGGCLRNLGPHGLAIVDLENNPAELSKALTAHTIDALGANRQRLTTLSTATPGTRLLPDNLFNVPQNIIVPKDTPGG